ncbi:hypothetical protein BegalDRAFT_2347 [Beggiatoa alba B18LD]|uniref:Uncharacterized protein n=1 Tax=Beggiatoa alba B18LD TaxID=395493 RepID=I3CHV8_9GAMM|nr:hypothetical protein [Beggiatoa alba]EIJ43201.1 hypothetical protein BegalDRAFT_2347 [Beggiatoa alba B18LD]
MSRQFSNDTNDTVKAHLDTLIDQGTDATCYANALYLLGKDLGEVLIKQIKNQEKVCLACTVEDADYLAQGVIEILTNHVASVALACFWNQRDEQQSIAPILRKYIEPDTAQATTLIIIKSVISGACVVKTNLTNLIQQQTKLETIIVASPVMHIQAKEKLANEFPKDLSDRFHYVYFATDKDKETNGTLIPGVGGNVYTRLGFKDQTDKNRSTPELIKNRRKLFISA